MKIKKFYSQEHLPRSRTAKLVDRVHYKICFCSTTSVIKKQLRPNIFRGMGPLASKNRNRNDKYWILEDLYFVRLQSLKQIWWSFKQNWAVHAQIWSESFKCCTFWFICIKCWAMNTNIVIMFLSISDLSDLFF